MTQHEKIRVLIVDSSLDFCVVQREWLHMQSDMECCAIATDGLRAIELIEQERPHVVLIDVVLPFLDGVGVLEYFSEHTECYRPRFIVDTIDYRTHIVQAATQAGADYVVQKPFDTIGLMRRIRLLANISDSTTQEDVLKQTIQLLVTDLGVPTNVLGFLYIQEVVLALQNAGEVKPAFKQLYMEIAVKYQSDWHCVEHAIAFAIRAAFANNTKTLRDVMGDDVKRMSNGKFCSAVNKQIGA